MIVYTVFQFIGLGWWFFGVIFGFALAWGGFHGNTKQLANDNQPTNQLTNQLCVCCCAMGFCSRFCAGHVLRVDGELACMCSGLSCRSDGDGLLETPRDTSD